MTVPFDAGRRRLLISALGLATTVAVGPRAIGLIIDRLVAAEEPATQLRGLVEHSASAARMGRSYLASVPREASGPHLVSLILDDPMGTRMDIPAQVRSRIHADLDAGSVVIVDGWVLSRTEARLFALCAIG